MRPHNVLTLSIVAVTLAACGARTGLEVGTERDGGSDTEPDAPFGSFPCTYGRSGDPVPVGETGRLSSTPSLAWADDRLGVAYRADIAEETGTLRFCRTPSEYDMTCTPSSLQLPETTGTVHLAFNGGEFGLCYTVLEGETSLASFVRLDRNGETIGAPRDLDGDLASQCHGLAWNGTRWVALLERWDAPRGVVVQAIDRNGELLRPPLIDFGLHMYYQASLSLDASPDRVAATAIADDGLHVRGLVRDLEPFHITVVGERLHTASVGIWGDQIGLLWSDLWSDGSSQVRFTFISGSPPAQGPTSIVATSEGAPAWVELEPVWDGFIAARLDSGSTDRLVVNALRFATGGRVEPQMEISVAEGTFAAFIRPSLSDDGHVSFVSGVFPDASGLHRVHLQLLSCHR